MRSVQRHFSEGYGCHPGPGDQPDEPNFAATKPGMPPRSISKRWPLWATDRQLNCEELGQLQKPLNGNGKIGFVWPI
jgi:hypothetical protein